MLDCSDPLQPPEIRPCLAELLRTGVYPAPVHLRIEKVRIEACSKRERGASLENEIPRGTEKAYRLFLGDGVLMVQALLESRLIELINLGDVTAGNIISLKRFAIKQATRLNGHGKVVFLGIADCDTVCSGGNMQQANSKQISSPSGHLGEGHVGSNLSTQRTDMIASAGMHERTKTRKRPAEELTTSQDSDCDDFETLAVDCNMVDQRRKVLHNMNVNRSFESRKSAIPGASKTAALSSSQQRKHCNSGIYRSSATQTATQSSPAPIAPHPPNSSHQKQRNCQRPATEITHTPHHHQPAPIAPPPPLQHQQQTPQTQHARPPSTSRPEPPHHTLLSLLSPPPLPPPSTSPSSPLPTKNYPCTILAIISWISSTLIPPRDPHSPFPPKRHVKIHDPSISARHAGVTVAVFCDAENFRPAVGTAGLFRGVVMQRTVGGDVILNAYERLMREDGIAGRVGRWFEDEPAVLEGLGWDVQGLRRWWEERVRMKMRMRKGRGRGRGGDEKDNHLLSPGSGTGREC